MLGDLIEVAGNSHFEAYVGGPLVGLVFACIFAGLSSRPAAGNGAQSTPHAVQLRIEQTIHIHAPAKTASSNTQKPTTSDDHVSAMIAALIALVVALFLFAAFLPRIAAFMFSLIAAVAVFSATAAILALVTRQFNNTSWYLHAILPVGVSIACFEIAQQAFQSINPEVTQFAYNLLGNEKISVGLIMSKAFIFFRQISNDLALWMMCEMLAFSLCSFVF